MMRHDGSERRALTVAQLIDELKRCEQTAAVHIWNPDTPSWEPLLFIDQYGIEGVDSDSAFAPKVRLGSHVYDSKEREKVGLA